LVDRHPAELVAVSGLATYERLLGARRQSLFPASRSDALQVERALQVVDGIDRAAKVRRQLFAAVAVVAQRYELVLLIVKPDSSCGRPAAAVAAVAAAPRTPCDG
jgi:hypothetical protein